MNVRAKFVLTGITKSEYGGTTLRFDCRYDDTIPEDQRFYDATPSGHIEMLVNNPNAVEFFELGKAFYADFSPVD